MDQDKETKRVIKKLERYAKAIAHNILQKFNLAHDRDWQEDISQSLLLEGWKVWRDTGNEGLARHRMSSRANNEKEKLFNTLTQQPRPVTSLGLGEQAGIRRKLNDGGCNHHVYYRCGNNHPDNGHPKVRWREADIEQAIIKEWERFRFPDPATADWYREAVQAAFEDVGSTTAMRRKMLTKRQTELTNMQDRLLNGYLAGTIDEPTFQMKSADLKSQLEDVECQLDEADQFDPAFGQTALAVFDFGQNLVPLWRGSNSARKRTILECVSLNRMLSDVNLVLVKRRPFDFLVERPFLKKSRGDWI